jgi:glyoxylase-like metal-dependent hydrolase (beta-lactamase superfamily II)
MKITRVGQYSLQLTRLNFVNCYLVREDDGYTLVDAGLKGSEEEILKASGNIPIKRIILTHPHIDHLGSVDALIARIPGVSLGASERSILLMRIPPDLSLRPGEVGKIAGGVPGIKSEPSLVIQAGDRVGSLLAIDTPGHIHGHLSFLDERDGTLYAGDALFCLGFVAVATWTPWWFPLKVYSSRAQAKESAIRLLEYPIHRFACGHGKVRGGGKEALEEAIARAKL